MVSCQCQALPLIVAAEMRQQSRSIVTAGHGLAQVWGALYISLGIQTSSWGSALVKLLGGRQKKWMEIHDQSKTAWGVECESRGVWSEPGSLKIWMLKHRRCSQEIQGLQAWWPQVGDRI